ncbi:MAG: hypothetical protein KF774_18980 [Planctomyces sp.]|nr:hypothetical protein [Planctomyces sp.]
MSCEPEPLQSSDTDRTPLAAWIEVQRGRTRFPRRPLARDRFLIGAGSNCDLQLGAPGVPILHSVILATGSELRIEAVVAAPPLLVDGWAVRDAILSEGAIIDLAGVRLVVHLGALPDADAALAGPVNVAALAALQQQEADEARRLRETSTSELVDRIADELARLEALAERRLAGWTALAAAAAACGPPADQGASDTTPHDAVLLPLRHETDSSPEDVRRIA